VTFTDSDGSRRWEETWGGTIGRDRGKEEGNEINTPKRIGRKSLSLNRNVEDKPSEDCNYLKRGKRAGQNCRGGGSVERQTKTGLGKLGVHGGSERKRKIATYLRHLASRESGGGNADNLSGTPWRSSGRIIIRKVSEIFRNTQTSK